MIPELLGPELLSTSSNELNCAFSPDGSMLVFSEWNQGLNTLMAISRQDDGWGERKVLPFSGSWSDVDPVFSNDGSRLYFSSKRPSDDDDQNYDSNLWYVQQTEAGGWGEPALVAGVSSPEMDEYYTSISLSGTLYFSVFREHGSPGDIYRSDLLADGYAPPELVAEPVSSEHSEHDPLIAPDGSYLIFTSDRPGGIGRGDLWIVFRTPDGGWSEAQNMGPEINTEGYDYCAMLSPDQRYLFFTRNTGGNGEIYWVDAKVIDQLR
jgi:Tol biopolymer transport system component